MRINCLRWYRFKSKIYRKLPRYHPKSGQRLDWRVELIKSGGKYDSWTGKSIKGYSILSITQRSPGSIMCDVNCYVFNWKTKSIERIKHAQWC